MSFDGSGRTKAERSPRAGPAPFIDDQCQSSPLSNIHAGITDQRPGMGIHFPSSARRRYSVACRVENPSNLFAEEWQCFLVPGRCSSIHPACTFASLVRADSDRLPIARGAPLCVSSSRADACIGMHTCPASPKVDLAGKLSIGFRLRSSAAEFLPSSSRATSSIGALGRLPIPLPEGPPIEERRCAPVPLAGSVGHRADYRARRGPVRDE